MDRISSDYLYHYKRDLAVVKLILQYGFRHNMWEEKVIFRDSVQQNFIVCFCDILADQAEYHRKCYGDISIVLTKDWGIKNNITPVRYVHKSSVGQFPDYIKTKNINREIRQHNVTTNQHHQYAIEYLCMALAKDSGQMQHLSIAQSAAAHPNWDKFLEDFDKEFEELENELKPTGKDKILYKYFHSIGNRLLELHNELEKRDALMRVYQDDFASPATGTVIKDKILYDEREWRSVKYFGDQDYQKNPGEYKQALIDKYMPQRFNLTFDSKDFVAILMTNKKEIDDLKNFINSNKTFLNPATDLNKIMLYSDFKE
jgi:hypothetical protein